MKRYPLFRLLLVAATLTISVGCTNSEKKAEAPVAAAASPMEIANRAPASPDRDEDRERSFRSLMTDSGVTKMRTTYFDRTLSIYYKAEKHLVDFEREAERAAQRAEKATRPLDPLASKSYTELSKMYALSERMLGDISYVYRRLRETRGANEGVSEADRARSQTLLDGFKTWSDGLAPEDHVQLQGLFDMLAEIHAETRFDEASNRTEDASRDTASADAAKATGFDPRKYLYNEAAIGEVFKTKSKEIQQKSSDHASKFKATGEEVALLEAIGTPFASERAPSAAKYVPSTGANGNLTGAEFPVGAYALTFDDGPKRSTTDRLLGILSANNVKVSFFWLAPLVTGQPATVAKAKAADHSINNHSWTHSFKFARLGPAGWQKEVVASTQAIKKAIGQDFRFYRCPFGACIVPAVPAIRKLIADQRLIHAKWNIDSADWKLTGQPDRIVAVTANQIKATRRGIILMHDIHEASVTAAGKLLQMIKGGQFGKMRLVTMDEITDEINR